MVAAHTVSHRGTEQTLDGTEYGDYHGCGEEPLHVLPAQVGHGQSRNFSLDFTELVINGIHMITCVFVEKVNTYRHQDNRYQRAGDFLGNLGRKDNHQHTEQSHCRSHPIQGEKMLRIHCPFRQEVARQSPLYLQTKQVLDLRSKDGHGNTAGEAHDNRIRDKLDDRAKPTYAQQYQEKSRQHRGHHQPRKSQGWVADDAENDYDKCACGTTYLYTASTQRGNQETTDDGGQNTL